MDEVGVENDVTVEIDVGHDDVDSAISCEVLSFEAITDSQASCSHSVGSEIDKEEEQTEGVCVKEDIISNKQIQELFKSLKDRSMVTVIAKFKETFPSLKQSTSADTSLYKKIKAVYETVKKFKRNKKEEQLQQYLSAMFIMPMFTTKAHRRLASGKTEKERNLATCLSSKESEIRQLKRNVSQAELEKDDSINQYEDLQREYNSTREVLECLEGRLKKLTEGNELEKTQKSHKLLQIKFNTLSKKLDEIQQKLPRLKSDKIRNLNKKMKRRDLTIENQAGKIASLETENAEAEENLRSLEMEFQAHLGTLGDELDSVQKASAEVAKLKAERRSIKRKLSYHRLRSYRFSRPRDRAEKEIENLWREVKQLRQANLELQQLVNLLEDDEVVTFHDGRFTDDVREIIMNLLSMNVSMNKVNDVIKVVLKKLAGKDARRLPSAGVKSRLLTEARCLAHKQVAEAMLQSDPNTPTGNVLHGDGTSKYHRHFHSFQVTLPSGQSLSFGMNEVAGGDTVSIMKSFTQSIDDLAEVIFNSDGECSDAIKEHHIARLVTSIKCTMSDQGAVNPCFNRQLAVLRENLLARSVKNWDTLTSESKRQMVSMGNFFCRMHILVNFATECDKTLKIFEGIVSSADPSQTTHTVQTSESGAARLIRSAVKAFHPHGSKEAGVASHFKSYLHGVGDNLRLASYRGIRFNILFYDAAALYYHRQHIISFLERWPNPNYLLKAVQEDLQSTVNLAGVRALGIIDKIISGPLWRAIEGSNSILDVNQHLHQLQISLERWCKDASSLLDGEPAFDVSIPIHKDELYNAVFHHCNEDDQEPTQTDVEFDQMTVQALEMVCFSLLLILERQAADQLPGGKYHIPTEYVRDMAANVPTTNTVSERDFGLLDMFMRSRPAASTLAYEALIMWTNNSTRTWLDDKTLDEKAKLMQDARVNAPSVIEKYKERKAILVEEKLKVLLPKQENKEKKEIRDQAKRETIANKLSVYGGVWRTEEKIDEELRGLPECDKRKALLCQIDFHQIVLKSSGNKKLFNHTEICSNSGRRRDLTISMLKSNLLEILRLNPVTAQSTALPTRSPLLQEQAQTIIDQEKLKLHRKITLAREKRLITKCQEKLPFLLKNPSDLIGQRIKHKCISKGTQATWYTGKVTQITETNEKNSLKTLYCVKYNDNNDCGDDDDEDWIMPLLQDLKNGDLIIL